MEVAERCGERGEAVTISLLYDSYDKSSRRDNSRTTISALPPWVNSLLDYQYCILQRQQKNLLMNRARGGKVSKACYPSAPHSPAHAEGARVASARRARFLVMHRWAL